MILAILLGILGWASIFWIVYRLLKADGDFTILWKARIPSDAFKNKVVWITGASQGIGEVMAKEFASRGAKLIISARRTSELERVRACLTGLHAPDGVVILPLDVASSEEAITEAVETAESAFDGKGVDIMVHNAAAPRPKLEYSKIPEDMTTTSFAVNVLGVITLTRFLAPKMAARGRGHLVVISSAAGKVGAPGQSVYSATKHAVNGYFNAVRNEIGSNGIKVSIICPGPVKTDPTSAENRQPLHRVTDLVMKSIYYELNETWIAIQPILTMMYLQQYCPSVASYLLQKIGPKRVQQGNTYSLKKMMQKDA